MGILDFNFSNLEKENIKEEKQEEKKEEEKQEEKKEEEKQEEKKEEEKQEEKKEEEKQEETYIKEKDFIEYFNKVLDKIETSNNNLYNVLHSHDEQIKNIVKIIKSDITKDNNDDVFKKLKERL